MLPCVVPAMLALIGCTRLQGEARSQDGLAYFSVEFAPGTPLGSDGQPLAEAADGHSFIVTISARDGQHQLLSGYAGLVEIRPQAARLASIGRVALAGGVADGVPVLLRLGAGREVLSVHEVEPTETVEGFTVYRDTGRLGVSPTIHLPIPSIELIQRTHDGASSSGFVSLYNKRNLTLSGHPMVVTAVLEGGFYLQQLDAASHAGMYLYTHSTPYVEDGTDRRALEAGSVIVSANGSVFEFFGFTEMSFPTFTPLRDGQGHLVIDTALVPAPVDITALVDASDHAAIESHEATVITVSNVTVDDFDENDYTYVEYAQFPLRTQAGRYVMAITLYSAPAFRPSAHKGDLLASFTGVLKQHRAARPSTWIIVPRNNDDVVFP